MLLGSKYAPGSCNSNPTNKFGCGEVIVFHHIASNERPSSAQACLYS